MTAGPDIVVQITESACDVLLVIFPEALHSGAFGCLCRTGCCYCRRDFEVPSGRNGPLLAVTAESAPG